MEIKKEDIESMLQTISHKIPYSIYWLIPSQHDAGLSNSCSINDTELNFHFQENATKNSINLRIGKYKEM